MVGTMTLPRWAYVTYAYGADNKKLSVADTNNNVTHFAYYSSGNGASLMHTATRPSPDGIQAAPVYSFAYDAAGKLTTATDPIGIVKQNAYDTAENLLSTTLDPGTGTHVGAVTSYSYDAIGNTIHTTDPRGAVTEDSFDSERRKTESHHHDGAITATLNEASRTTYDALDRDIKDETGLTFSGTTVATWQTDKTTVYTPMSKPTVVTDADGSVTNTAYDALDRIATVTDPIGRKDHFQYDAAGNTLFEYRAWQSPLKEKYASYSYGADNEKLSVADANTNITNFGYDGFNRLLTTTYPDSAVGHLDVETLAYDADSNITSRITRANQTLTYSFDTLDRMITKVMPAITGINPQVTTTWTYYLNGLTNTLTDTNSNSLTYGYDSAGRMTSTSTAIPGITGSLVTGYQLDLNSNRTQLTWPDGYYVAYAYDSLDRMTTATENGTTNLATYTYDTLSRRTILAYGNAASMAYTYSPAGDLKTLNHDMSGSAFDAAYTLNYTLDHQLASEANTKTGYVWEPGANTTTGYTVNNLNQYATVNTTAWTYDGNGNLTSDGTFAYAYDPENHLLSANKTGTAATYAYDSLGRRAAKTVNTVSTYFLDDGSDEITEYGPNTSNVIVVQRRFVPGPAINEPIAMVDLTSGTAVDTFFHTDHHGSVIAMSGAGAAHTEGPFRYDPYGSFTGTATGEPYRFEGMRYDLETGLYYDRARYYCPTCGRFLQTDPVGYKADLNLYTYVGNDPTDKDDPMGLQGCYPNCPASSSSTGKTTTIVHADGTVEVRHGAIAFRDNNPGDLRSYDFSERHDMIGVDNAKPNGPFAVFENTATGDAALRALLKSPDVQDRTIEGEMKKFAPDTDKNDPAAYAQALSNAIGVPATTKMSDLTSGQFDSFVNTVKQKEGYNDPNGTVKIKLPEAPKTNTWVQ